MVPNVPKSVFKFGEKRSTAVADPDLELRKGAGGRGEGGLGLLASLAFFNSVISSFLQ